MDRLLLAAGAAALCAGAVGYAAGVFVAYPGRSFSVTAFMLGLALVVVGRTAREANP
ncbi:hypothetical protein HWV07_13120 [Natronomonas salina]|uniref:hypothetical protein n=1 Tax=Natronomonas salina TaxID=1710540 RepID=UPI0015B559E2|nr:hypothetical protein [Natronomonas salina]QLD89917.1 hypothetical protein HWV07_13120 [Natronomonas salina]